MAVDTSDEMKQSAKAITDPKGRRVTIDLTIAAASEVDRLRTVTGLTTADVFRYALSLFRIYVDAKQGDRELQIIDPANPDKVVRIELPVEIVSAAKE